MADQEETQAHVARTKAFTERPADADSRKPSGRNGERALPTCAENGGPGPNLVFAGVNALERVMNLLYRGERAAFAVKPDAAAGFDDSHIQASRLLRVFPVARFSFTLVRSFLLVARIMVLLAVGLLGRSAFVFGWITAPGRAVRPGAFQRGRMGIRCSTCQQE